MTSQHKINIYCLTHNNPERLARMQHRFQQTGLSVEIYESLSWNHPAIDPGRDDINHVAWGCMWGHVHILRKFLRSDADYCLVLEDDVLIHHNIKDLLPELVDNFTEAALDVVSLGYLCNIPVTERSFNPKMHCARYDLLDPPDWIWGTQSYLCSRNHAAKINAIYNAAYAAASLTNLEITPFAADWTITKTGNRAIINPPLVVEEGYKQNTDDLNYVSFHQQCHQVSYDPAVHI